MEGAERSARLGAMTRYRALCHRQFISLSNDGAEDLAQPCRAVAGGERQDNSTSLFVKVAVSSQLRESKLLLDTPDFVQAKLFTPFKRFISCNARSLFSDFGARSMYEYHEEQFLCCKISEITLV